MSCCAVGQAGGDRCHATRVWLILEDSGCCQGESERGPPWVGARGYASRASPQALGSNSIWGEPRGHRTLSPPHHATVCFFLLFPWQSCLSLSVLALFPSLSPNLCSQFPGVPDGKRHNPNAGGLVETCRWWNHRNPAEEKARDSEEGGFHVCCDLPHPSSEWHWGNLVENE